MMQKDLLPVWKEQYRVGAYDTNTRAEIKLGKLTGYIQEAAWYHANLLGLGTDFMHKNKMIWILSAIKLHIDRYPRWMESFTIETWPRDIDRLFYLRDFLLLDCNNDCFGLVTTKWLLLDVKSLRPKNPVTKELEQVMDKSRMVFENEIEKLPKIEKGEVFIQKIDYMDYDLNKHVNSNRFVDIILGTFPYDYHQKRRVVDFQLNFLKEIKGVDSILMKKQRIGENEMFLIEGHSLDEKNTYFQSFVVFE